MQLKALHVHMLLPLESHIQPLLHITRVISSVGVLIGVCYCWRQAHFTPRSRRTDLVELKDIQKVKELPVLLVVLQFHVVLLQPVQRQLRLIIHEDLHWLGGRGEQGVGNGRRAEWGG